MSSELWEKIRKNEEAVKRMENKLAAIEKSLNSGDESSFFRTRS